MPEEQPRRPGDAPDRMGEQREDQDREDPEEADHRDDRKLHALAADGHRNVERNLELARAQRVVQAQRDERDEDERIARRRAERVEIGEEVEPVFAAEEMRVHGLRPGIERRQRGEDQFEDGHGRRTR